MDLKFLSLSNLGGVPYDIFTKSRNKSITVYCAGTGLKEHITANLDKFILYVAPDTLQAKSVTADLKEYLGDDQVVYIPEKEEVLLFQKASSKQKLIDRVYGLSQIVQKNVKVAVVSALGLLQYYPKKSELENRIITISKDQEIEPFKLADKLIECGYLRVDSVKASGEFSLRGDVMDIFIGGSLEPVRISFFGDLIESITKFELVSIKMQEKVQELQILPLSDILLNDSEVSELIEKLDKIDENETITNIIEDVKFRINNNKSDYTLSWIIPFIINSFSTIFDYLDGNSIIVIDEAKMVSEKIDVYLLEHTNRVYALSEANQVLMIHKKALLSRKEVLYYLNKQIKLSFMSLQSNNPLYISDFIFKLRTKPIIKYYLDPKILIDDIKKYRNLGYLVLLCADNVERAKALKESFRENNLIIPIVDEITEKSGAFLVPIGIRKGFEYPLNKLLVIGTEELLGKRHKKSRFAKRKNTFSAIKEGDFVVHEVHGIGLCEGVEKIATSDFVKDYVVIGYKNGDKLYVPIDQMDMLTKYSGGDRPRLSKIGGADFKKVKDKVRASIKEMAFDLLELYSERDKSVGYVYAKDTIWQKEFEDEFEFDETPDQLQAISDTKKDMESGKVMDRLICGDVGYGKTEVAFRAMFKTIVDSKQTALLAPTTILASQHYNNLKERLKPFDMNIRLLTRMQSTKENNITIKGISDGTVDVVIATHRLLSKDVAFKDLGLLVLDEEQRFGVEHKEKMKLLQKNINVLTLSATPIPRTLHMAMTGIRDINVLDTPPVNRLPIETYVVEYSDSLVVDAITRELARGGQVFVLYNYVERIDTYAARLNELLKSQAKILVAHGQMKAGVLEKRINSFYNKEADVLVCTTIIENGIDLPNANTLIVYDADRFGLSQLHQLRGRVGRSGLLAHAYFTTRPNKVLTAEADSRLVALSQFTEFGSGLQIALKDLEIRGAGNVLGKQQHGHMEKVGYELYTKMLKETITEIKTGVKKTEVEQAEVKIDIDSFIPEDFANSIERMAMYKKIGAIKNITDSNNLKIEIKNGYGKLPSCIENLIDIALIKQLAINIDVQTVVINKKQMGLIFKNVNVYKNANLMEAVSDFDKECVLTATNPIRIIFDTKNKNNPEKLNLLIKFLQKSNGV